MALPWEKYETLSEAELNFLGFEWKPIWRVVVIDLIYFGSKEAKNYEVSGEFFFQDIATSEILLDSGKYNCIRTERGHGDILFMRLNSRWDFKFIKWVGSKRH